MNRISMLWQRIQCLLYGSLRRTRTWAFTQLAALVDMVLSLQTSADRREAWRAALPILVFFAGYLAAYAFGNRLPSPAPLWPPDAILLAALLLAPKRRWWVYLLVTVPIRLLPAFAPGIPTWLLVINLLNDTLQALLAAVLVRRFTPPPLRFMRLHTTGLYLAFAVLLAPLLSATVGAFGRAILGSPYWLAWQTWFLGDAMAALVLTPTIVMWATSDWSRVHARLQQNGVEVAVLASGLLLVMGLVSYLDNLRQGLDDPLYYLPIPLLVWAAVRFGSKGIASTLTVLTFFVIPGATRLADQQAPLRTPQEVLSLQLYLIATAVPLLLLAAQIEERRHADISLQASEMRYRDVVESQSELISRYLPDTTLTFVNEANCRVMGLAREQLLGAKFINLIPKSERKLVLATIWSLVAQPGVSTIEHQVRIAGGSLRWQQWVNRTILDDQGHVVELQGIGRDITEQKLLEQEREAAHRDAERRTAELEATFEAIADGVAVFDTEGRFLRENAALRRLLGGGELALDYTRISLSEQLGLFAVRNEQGRPLRDSSAGPLSRALLGELVNGPQTRNIHIHTLDGREIEVGVSAAPLRSPDGQVVGAVLALRDQTERNRLAREREEALAASEEWFHTLADTAPVLVWVSGPDGLVTFLNQPWLQFTGRTEDQELGEGWAEGVHPDDYADCLGAYWAAFRAREPFRMEYRLRRADGEYRWVLDTGVPRFARDGSFAGYIGSAIDVSERRALERQLAEQAEQLERIVEAMGDGLFVYDPEGRVVRTNQAARRLLGIDPPPPDFYDLSAEERIARYAPRDLRDQFLTPEGWLMTRAARDGDVLRESEARDLRMRTLDGRELEVSASVAPLRGPDGQITGVVLLLNDRTERNQLAREREEAQANERVLRDVNERLDTFAAMSAHDLRGPVAVSRMVAQTARKQLQEAASRARLGAGKQANTFVQAARALELISQNLDRLWRLVQQLLDVARVKQGILVLERRPVDLSELVSNCVHEQRILTPSRVIVIEAPDHDPATAGAAPVIVEADPDRLDQVLTNYLANAVRYAPDSQPITVSIQILSPMREDGEDGDGQFARVVVRDKGPGISPEDQTTIWERFQRAHSPREVNGGLGLGLNIVRTIVELHGGKVGVDSALGAGSAFWLTLPMVLSERDKHP